MYRRSYAGVFEGDELWKSWTRPGRRFAWADDSTYVRQPPYFENMPREAPAEVAEIHGARAVAFLATA